MNILNAVYAIAFLISVSPVAVIIFLTIKHPKLMVEFFKSRPSAILKYVLNGWKESGRKGRAIALVILTLFLIFSTMTLFYVQLFPIYFAFVKAYTSLVLTLFCIRRIILATKANWSRRYKSFAITVDVASLISIVLGTIYLYQNKPTWAATFAGLAVIGLFIGKAGSWFWSVILWAIIKNLPNTIFNRIAGPWIDKGKQWLIGQVKKAPEAGIKATPEAEPQKNESAQQINSTPAETPPAIQAATKSRKRTRAAKPPEVNPETEPTPAKRARKRTTSITTDEGEESKAS